MSHEEATVPSGNMDRPSLEQAPSGPGPPQGRIGAYRIVRLLGQGGMGLVYEAEQLEPLHRTVALKLIRHGMDTDEVLSRFESERQALTVMDHPNIARALDAGTTEDGLPFFVMELVPGVPITEYCDTHLLDVRGRLELFIAVCKGVQHAHQKGIIHRDLKPSNVLVRVVDEKPVPTIIDFGIAKAVEGQLSGAAFTTELGIVVGTPAYMSPEQAKASGLDIDTRADIYSLGMLLYELVAGVLPFELRGLLPGPFIAQYLLGHADVPTPSRRVAGLVADTATAVAERRHTTPLGLRRELRGDIDWIVLKAIEWDRGRRYETANALALDLERHLEHKPVTARPPTPGYTAAKFVRRHRLGVSVLVTAVALLLVAIVSITRERNRAEREGAKARAISGFLQDMLKSADPWEGGARQTTVVDALRAGVKQLDAGSIADPVVAASVRRTIGSVYLSFGRFTEADTLLRAVLAERLARGRRDAETAESWADLGGLLVSQGKLDSAGVAYERALVLRRELLGPRDTLVAASLLDIADLATEMGQLRRADSLAQEALTILRAAHGDRHPAIARTMGRIAGAYLGRGDYGRTDSITRPAIAMLREVGLGRSPQITGILNDLALSRMYQGDYQEASALMHEVLAIDSALYGSSHPYLAMHLENMAMIYDYLGFADSNVMVLNQTLAMRRAVLPEDSPDIGRTLFNLGTAEYLRGNYEAAEPLYEESLARMRRAYGPLHPDIVWATATLGRNQYRLGRRAEAERNLRWALHVTDPDGRLDPPAVARVGQELVALYLDQRRWAEAEPVALRVLAIRDSMGDTLARQSAAQLAELYEGWGKQERADEYYRRAGMQ